LITIRKTINGDLCKGFSGIEANVLSILDQRGDVEIMGAEQFFQPTKMLLRPDNKASFTCSQAFADEAAHGFKKSFVGLVKLNKMTGLRELALSEM